MRVSCARLLRRVPGRWTLLYLLVLGAVALQLLPVLSSLAVPAGRMVSVRDTLNRLAVLRRGEPDTSLQGRVTGTSGDDWSLAHNCSVVGFLASPDPTARVSYDPSLVCGPPARDKDIVCSMFFSRLGLRDDGDCLRKTDDSTVPRIVYFVIFGDFSFKFWHYVSVMAAKRFIAPSALYVVGDAHPMGYWWKRLTRDCKGVRYVYRPRPGKVAGQEVKSKRHLSDLVRLQVLYLNGGIYLDTDMVMTRDPGPILTHNITMGLIENGTGMGNAFIAVKRNSDFIRDWYNEYNHYNNTFYYRNSLHVPRDMWHRQPGRLHMESKRLYSPNWFEADKLFKRWDFDWSQNYAVHVWTNGNPVPMTEEEIQEANTTIAQVFRNALYGDPRPRQPSIMGKGNPQDIV